MRLDHTIVPSQDKEATARFFTEVLGFGLGEELPDARFVHVNDELTLRCDEKYADHVHLAFHVTRDELSQVIERARAGGTPFGSLANAMDDELGELHGGPRIYLRDPSGNSIELLTVPTPRP